MYQFKTEIRNLNRYSQLGRIIYNGPADTYYNGQNLKVALLVYERRNSLRCNDWNYAVQYRDWETDRKSTRLNSSHRSLSRMPSSA